MVLAVDVQRQEEPGNYTVALTDPEVPGYAATFTYAPFANRFEQHFVHLKTVAVERVDESGLSEPLRVSELRDLPLSRWEKAAYTRVTDAEQERLERKPFPPATGWKKRILAEVARHRPDLAGAPLGDKQAQRSLRSHMHLVEAAWHYRAAMASGIPDPAGEVARQFDVKPTTARAWIHRARKAGYLGPATGPSAGEGAEES